jgi:hypothetical protein
MYTRDPNSAALLSTDHEPASAPFQAREGTTVSGGGANPGLGHAWILVGFVFLFSVAIIAWGMASRNISYASKPMQDTTTGIHR